MKFDKLVVYRLLVFIGTFLFWGAIHSARKTIGVIFKSVKDILPAVDDNFLAYMSSSFMMAYAIGMIFTGALGDRFKPTKVLFFASLGVIAIEVAVGLLLPEHPESSYWALYVILWTLNGLFQSCMWPILVKLVSEWMVSGHSGLLFGLC